MEQSASDVAPAGNEAIEEVVYLKLEKESDGAEVKYYLSISYHDLSSSLFIVIQV